MTNRPDWLLAILSAGIVASPAIGFGIGYAASEARAREMENHREGKGR